MDEEVPLPPLRVRVLAENDLPQHVVNVDGTHVYFETDDGVWRVPRAGGPVERAEVSPPFDHVTVDGRLGGGSGTARLGANEVEIDATGVFRTGSAGRRMLARSFVGAGDKPLVLDAERAYWLEPAAGAVLSVPLAGGPVRVVAEVLFVAEDSLALRGDVLYVLDAGGSLGSVAKAGGAQLRWRGVCDTDGELAATAMVAGDDGLYVSYTNREPLSRDVSRIVHIADPGPAPAATRHPALHFSRRVGVGGQAPTADELEILSGGLAPITDELRNGDLVLTLLLPIGAPDRTDTRVGVTSLIAWLHERFGPELRIELIARPLLHARSTDVYVGITSARLPALYAPR